MVAPVPSPRASSQAGEPHQASRKNPPPPTRSRNSRQVGDRVGVGLAVGQRLGVQAPLELVQELAGGPPDPLDRHRRLGPAVPPDQGGLPGGQLAGAQLDPDGHALQLPVDRPAAERQVEAAVDVGPDPLPAQLLGQLVHGALDLALGQREQHHLVGGDRRRQAQPVVVAVGHDHPAQHPGGAAPGGGGHVLAPALRRQVLDVEGAGEVVPEVVAGPHLQGLAVAHQALAGVGAVGPGEPLGGRLLPGDHRAGQGLLHERPVHLQGQHGLGLGLLVGGVGGVALLPEELGGAQEQPRAQLPADHVGPLVEQHRAGRGGTGSTWRTGG